MLRDYGRECSQQSLRGLKSRAELSEASSVEAAERCLDLGIGCELSALGLSEAFQDVRQVSRVYFFQLTLIARQGKHGACDFILAIRGQLPHGFESLFKELGHDAKHTPFSEPAGRGFVRPLNLRAISIVPQRRTDGRTVGSLSSCPVLVAHHLSASG